MTHQERFLYHINRFLSTLSIVLFGICIGLLIRYFCGFGMDSTDTSSTERSNMTLHKDAETGVHYLSVGGYLRPRLRADGSIYVEERP